MDASNNKILFPIDFQKQSTIALEYAVYFAKITRAQLILLHIIEEGNFLTKMFSSPKQMDEMQQKVQKMLDDAAKKIEPEVEVTTILEIGKAYDKILSIAEQQKPKFIIIGKSQEPSFARNLIGSNCMHLIKGTTIPIITIRGEEYLTDYESTDRDIVVPLDITKEVKEQITASIAFAKYFKSKIKLLTVLDKDSIGLELKMLTRLNNIQKVVEQAGIECEKKLVKDVKNPIVDVVLDFAKKQNSHLIVIMTQDEINVVEYFIGHTAIEIIDKSSIPVLSVLPSNVEKSVFGNFIDPFKILGEKK